MQYQWLSRWERFTFSFGENFQESLSNSLEDIQSVNNSFEKEPSNSVLNLDDDSSQKPNLDLERNPNRQKATDLSLYSFNDYPDETESNFLLEDIDSVDRASERDLSNSS